MSPYVGMARKQNGGYNASISVQTPIFHLVVNSTRLKTVRSARWCCPNSTMAPRLLENVVKVTNLEVVKIDFRHLPFLPSFFLSFFSASPPTHFTRAPPLPAKNRYLNSSLMILHASELATELFDEVQSPRCTFATSIATAAWSRHVHGITQYKMASNIQLTMGRDREIACLILLFC